MDSNGHRRPPRPEIRVMSSNVSEAEAAAITAALEQFLVETAPRPPAEGPSLSPWQQSALREGVGARSAVISPWGSAPWAA